MEIQYLLAMMICITALASYVNHRFIHLPKTIGLTVVTLSISWGVILLLALGQYWIIPVKKFLNGVDFDETLINGMLNFFLFASALNIDLTKLLPHKKMIAALATLSVLISCLLIGLSLFYILKVLGHPLSLLYCFLFGALIAPTDPLTVLNALKRSFVPSEIRLKIMGEALFNDAAGIVLFIILLQWILGNNPSPIRMVLLTLQEGGGGLLLGYLLGIVGFYLLKSIKERETAILITLALVAGGFNLALFLHCSAPIAMVVAGLLVGAKIRKLEYKEPIVKDLFNFWQLVDDILVSFLFTLIGLETLDVKIHLPALLIGIGVFILVNLIRSISIAASTVLFEPLKSFNFRNLAMMTWSGIRGGVSIALALMLPVGPEKNLLLNITYMVVILSIIVQGLTLKNVAKRLFPSKLPT